jgi:hypothetical protein
LACVVVRWESGMGRSAASRMSIHRFDYPTSSRYHARHWRLWLCWCWRTDGGITALAPGIRRFDYPHPPALSRAAPASLVSLLLVAADAGIVRLRPYPPFDTLPSYPRLRHRRLCVPLWCTLGALPPSAYRLIHHLLSTSPYPHGTGVFWLASAGVGALTRGIVCHHADSTILISHVITPPRGTGVFALYMVVGTVGGLVLASTERRIRGRS